MMVQSAIEVITTTVLTRIPKVLTRNPKVQSSQFGRQPTQSQVQSMPSLRAPGSEWNPRARFQAFVVVVVVVVVVVGVSECSQAAGK